MLESCNCNYRTVGGVKASPSLYQICSLRRFHNPAQAYAPAKNRGRLQLATARAFNARSPAEKWHGYPNLRRRPHAPNKGRGRLQRAIARAFLVAGSDTLSSTAVYDWCFARDRHRPLGVAPLFRLADPAGGRDAGGCSRCAPRIAIFSSCY